jgi:hypothetical protein
MMHGDCPGDGNIGRFRMFPVAPADARAGVAR